MNQLKINLDKQSGTFSPGEILSGSATWNLSTRPGKAEVHLLWFTEGKGTRDAEIIESVTGESISQSGELEFRWKLPLSPYTYHGTLLSILWQVELVIDGVSEITSVPISLTPVAAQSSSSDELQGKTGWFPDDLQR